MPSRKTSKTQPETPDITPPGENQDIVSPPEPLTNKPDSIDDILPELSAPSSDAAAAVEILDDFEPPASSAPDAPSTPSKGPPASSTPAGHWSRNKMRNSSKSELMKRIQELQEQMPAGASGSASKEGQPIETAPPPSTDEVKATVSGLLGAVDAVARHAAPELALSEDERTTLAGAFVPAATPHYAMLRDRFPWVIGALAALSVYAPKGVKLKERLDQERIESIDQEVLAGAEDAVELRVVQSAPFGGPAE